MTPLTSALRSRIAGGVAASVALMIAIAIATSARWGPDWPAQEFRAWSAAHDGLTSWTNGWYSGQPLPGYSVLYPLAARVLGAALTGLLAAVVGAMGAARLAPAATGPRRAGYLVSVCVVLGGDLLIGQVPYLMGVAVGVWAIVMVRSNRLRAAAVLAALASLASPLAGVFLLLAIPAVASLERPKRTVALLGASLGPIVSCVIGGAGGTFPFTPLDLACTSLFGCLCMAVPSPAGRPIRVMGATYAATGLLLFLVPNPVGANLIRLGQLVALPLIWHAWPRVRLRLRRPPVAVALVALAATWTVWPIAASVGRGATDPSQSRSYYTQLLGFLRSESPTAGRLEVVFTREHWEALYVAQAFPIARGWERQTDLTVNAALYQPLTPQLYRQWLDDNAVSLVALPSAPLDYGGRAEAALLRAPPSYLVPVWHDANWRVWRVTAPRPLVSGPATMTHLAAASFDLNFARAGTATVRIRNSSMWSVSAGKGCVLETSGAWLRVQASKPGPLVISARVGITALDPDTRCS